MCTVSHLLTPALAIPGTGRVKISYIHGTQPLPRYFPLAGLNDLALRCLPTMFGIKSKPKLSAATICHFHRCLASSMQSSLVALGSESGVVRLVDAAALSLTMVFRTRLHQGPISCMAFSPDAKLLAVVAGNRCVHACMHARPPKPGHRSLLHHSQHCLAASADALLI